MLWRMRNNVRLYTYRPLGDGAEYIAIPRQVGTQRYVEILLDRAPDVNDVIAARVGEDGKVIEASRLAVDRFDAEYFEPAGNAALSDGNRLLFQRIARAVFAFHPIPVPRSAIGVLSIPRRSLALDR